MNVFFVIDGTVVTPGLTDTILPGITRDSVIRVLQAMGTPVEERPVLIDEIVEAHTAGRLQECFGTGTAATINHVVEIGYQDKMLTLPPVPTARSPLGNDPHERPAHRSRTRSPWLADAGLYLNELFAQGQLPETLEGAG